MTTHFIFCRHGQSEINASGLKEETSEANSSLTDVGKEQSKKLAHALWTLIHTRFFGLKMRIVVSTLDRAMDTSAPFIDLLNPNQIEYELTYRNEIVEHLGKHKILDEKLLKRGLKKDDTWDNFINNRVFPFFQELCSFPPNCIVIFFTHGYFLSSLLSIIAVQGQYHGTQRAAFDPENCSMTYVTLNHDTKFWSIKKFSDTNHLQ